MKLPSALIDKVMRGKSILFLGSGALVGAELPGKSIPFGDDLRDLLDNQFLNGEYKKASLAHVAALAISQYSLFEVQDYIGEYFSDLTPADFHLKIPEFNWRAIFTTNYDRLVEKCYELNTSKLQEYIPIISNSDRLDETRTTNDKVLLIKLHGCITRTHDDSLPLILTVDQYTESLSSRNRLFSHLYELAYENSIIFVGHSLQDTDVRNVMLKLEKESHEGPRHYLIKPGVKDIEVDYWARKKITAINISLENFMDLLDGNINKSSRKVSLVRPKTSHPIEERFRANKKPSDFLIRFLTDHSEFVSDATKFSINTPKDFYHGINLGWYPISDGLCIERSLINRITQQVILCPEEDRPDSTELFVIKGEAGSGKTILLRQIAWTSKSLGIGIFIWVKPGIPVDIDALNEIYKNTNERVFLIWDDAARNSSEIYRTIINARQSTTPITIVTAERHNEWNTRCYELDDLVTDVFKLYYLNIKEIENLIGLLEQHESLGPNLIDKTPEERKIEFRDVAGRQLLVALYEATMGKSFEDIIYNEYCNITPESAKEIYLTVCTLNRMRVPVRAGLISRIHGVTFEKFKRDFFNPLERIVIPSQSGELDIHYTARHPEIAEIVFHSALSNTIERYNVYIRILSKINISFESDKSSFRTMIRAKLLHEIFPSYEDVMNIYDVALKVIGEDPYLLQQIANYERIRPNGNYQNAIDLLEKARISAPWDSSIIHSLAVVWRDRANDEKETLVKLKYRAESKAFLELAANKWGDSGYISCTLVDLALDNLVDLLNDDKTTDRSVDEAIRRAEEKLIETKNKYPSDGHVHTVEANFAEILKDNDRAITSLERAFAENNRDPFIATRLTKIYYDKGDIEKAKQTLQNAIARRSNNHRLNFQYAELLRYIGNEDNEAIAYHYRRAYTPGDQNYHAQFWYARYLYESGDRKDIQKANDIFVSLRRARLSHTSKFKIRDYSGDISNPSYKEGRLAKKRDGYGFITLDGAGQDIFFPSNNVDKETWELLLVGDRVKFKIGYSFTGPVCCDVEAV